MTRLAIVATIALVGTANAFTGTFYANDEICTASGSGRLMLQQQLCIFINLIL